MGEAPNDVSTAISELDTAPESHYQVRGGHEGFEFSLAYCCRMLPGWLFFANVVSLLLGALSFNVAIRVALVA